MRISDISAFVMFSTIPSDNWSEEYNKACQTRGPKVREEESRHARAADLEHTRHQNAMRDIHREFDSVIDAAQARYGKWKFVRDVPCWKWGKWQIAMCNRNTGEVYNPWDRTIERSMEADERSKFAASLTYCLTNTELESASMSDDIDTLIVMAEFADIPEPR